VVGREEACIAARGEGERTHPCLEDSNLTCVYMCVHVCTSSMS
jgi:hypothetical protein